eukprot:scaffold14060_cov133-Isochrysis_galbana.AAC.1
MSVVLSRVAAFVPVGAPAIRWFPPQVRAVFLTRDVRMPSNVVESPRPVYSTETQKNNFDSGHGYTAISLDGRALSESCPSSRIRPHTIHNPKTTATPHHPDGAHPPTTH